MSTGDSTYTAHGTGLCSFYNGFYANDVATERGEIQ